MKPVRMILAVALLAAGFVGGFGYGRWYGPSVGAARYAGPGPAETAQDPLLRGSDASGLQVG